MKEIIITETIIEKIHPKYFQFVITQNGTNEDGSVYTEYVPKVQELYNDIIKELEK